MDVFTPPSFYIRLAYRKFLRKESTTDACVGRLQLAEELRSIEEKMKRYDHLFHDYPRNVRHCTLARCRQQFAQYLSIPSHHKCIPASTVMGVFYSALRTCEQRRRLNSAFIGSAAARTGGKKVMRSRRRIDKDEGVNLRVSRKYFFYYPADVFYHCKSGHHWCCVFIGDDADFPCFELYCDSSRSSCKI